MLCKTFDKPLQKQAVNMDLQCILRIANSSYAVKTPKDEVTCDTYWNFLELLGGAPSFVHLYTKPVPGRVLAHSVDKTHLLVVTAEFIWLLFLKILSFNFVQTPKKSLRFRRFRSYVNHSVVVPTTVKIALLFMFYVRCLNWSHSFFV